MTDAHPSRTRDGTATMLGRGGRVNREAAPGAGPGSTCSAYAAPPIASVRSSSGRCPARRSSPWGWRIWELMTMPVLVGTSGWQYRDWRGRFYPLGLPEQAWLEYYATAFATVESNSTFYRLPEAATFEEWARRTPADFTWALKMSRYLTHLRRLREPAGPVELFLGRAARLGPKLGPILVQLPPGFPADPDRLEAALARFPARVRVAVEFRDESWYVEEVRAVLTRHGAALCLADRAGPLTPEWRTADWTYLRFHEGRGRPWPAYAPDELAAWAATLARGWGPEADVYAYFNNDPGACAPADAVDFARAAAAAGLHPTRVPEIPIRRAGV